MVMVPVRESIVSPHTRAGRLGVVCLLSLLAPLTLVFPVAAGVVLLLFISTCSREIRIAQVVTIAVIAGVFGWMNAEKAISGDWVWYTDHYLLLQTLPFESYIGSYVGMYPIKLTEPVYYYLSSVVSRLSGGNIPVLAVVISMLIYLPLGAAVTIATRPLVERPWQQVVVLIVALLMGVTFTLTTQLVRQEIASALLLLGCLLFYKKQFVLGGPIIILALGTHNSVIIPFACMAIAYITVALNWGQTMPVWLKVVLAALGMVMLGMWYIFVGPGISYYILGNSDGEISASVHLLDLGLLASFLVLRARLDVNKPLLDVTAAGAVIYSGFLLGVLAAPIPFLRMYFFVEVFRALIIGFIVASVLRSWYGTVLAVPLVFLAVIYVELRISTSPFAYEGGLLQHLFTPLF